MNKIYKVIWSKAKNCYIVVSEIAKRNGKCKSAVTKAIVASLLAGAIVMPLGNVEAAVATGIAGGAKADTNNSVALGSGSVTNEEYTVSVGNETTKRRITNVAAGISDTDAVNVAQLKAASIATDNRAVGLTVNSEGKQEITSPYIQIYGVEAAAIDSNKTGWASAAGKNSIAVGSYANVRTQHTLAEAQTVAYYDLQQTIKSNAALANVAAVQNATNYARLVNALNGVGSSIANHYLDQLNARVTALQSMAVNSDYSIAMGNNATVMGVSSVAVGNGAAAVNYTTGAGVNYATAIGNMATAGTNYAIAVGSNARAIGDAAIAIGKGAQAQTRVRMASGADIVGEAPGAIAVGENAWALTPYSVVIGSGGTGQQGLGGRINLVDSPEQGGYSISIGTRAANFGTTGNGYGYYANTRFSTAIGYAAHTHAANATAIGTSTDATGERSFAFGTASTNTDSVHMGTRAAGQGSIVIGDQATAYRFAKKDIENNTGNNLELHGTGADVYVNDAMAMGTGSWAKSRNALALGGGISYTYHQYGTDASGQEDRTTMTNVTKYYGDSGWQDDAEGLGAEVGLSADGAVAIGGATADVAGIDSAYFPTKSAFELSVSNYTAAATIGDNAKRAVAIGSGSKATLADSVALGSYSVADRQAGRDAAGNVQSGYDISGANHDKDNSGVWTSTLAAVSVGDAQNKLTRQITGVAAGWEDTDAVNVAQLKAAQVEVKAGDNVSVATTYENGHVVYTVSARGGNSVTISGGGDTVSADDRAVTVTRNSKDEKVVTSPYLHINGVSPSTDTNTYAQAHGADSIAMGRSATVDETAARGIAIGKRATVHGDDAVALGSDARATNHYSVALGSNAEASIHTSVALGSHSVTTAEDKAGIRTGKVGYDVATDSKYRGLDRYTPTWQSTAGSVSVGGGIEPGTGETVTRRISNVAAGVYDTDVVNVAQLKRATLYRTDFRNTAIGTDADGNTEISSPYINVHGVKEAAEAKTLLNVYKTYDSYESTLTKNVTTLTAEKASLTRDVKSLDGKISDLDAQMKALGNPGSEAYKALADEKAILVEEHTTLSSELQEVTALLTDTEASLKTAKEDYENAQELVNSQARAEGKESVALGAKSVASGDQTVAMGTANAISGNQSTAIGAGNTVTGNQSIAVGTGHEVHGSNSGTFGDPNIVAADYSYVVGNNNKVGTTALGKDVENVPTENIFVLGNDNDIETGKQHVYVLGSNVTQTESRSVFLGDGSGYVKEGKTTAGMSDYSSETINGKTYQFAGGKPVGVVSVGNENETRRIQNVAAGKISADSTDAINGSQLYSAIENVNNNVNDIAGNLGNQISNVDSRATKGIAGAAALAALHPLDFDPDDKLQFSAGMGHYRGKTAAAVGLFYRPDEKVMFNIGGTMGNGENLINAGVTFSLDRTPRVTASRTALTKEVVELREHVARQDAQIAELTALVRQLAGNAGVNMPTTSSLPVAMPALFPDNLDNKWAYDRLEELEQQGYIKGYAGRTLTRDEFAAALDTALKGGAMLEERLVKAFEPELSHVRVAHVEGNGNEEGKWYERPRFSYDKLEKKHEIEKKNARIVPAKQK